MGWDLVYTISQNYPVNPISIPITLSNPSSIIRASFNQGSPSWHFAGWMIPVIEISVIGRVEGIWQKVYFGTKVVEFEVFSLPFELEFRAVGWLYDINLSIWTQPLEEVQIPVYIPSSGGVVSPIGIGITSSVGTSSGTSSSGFSALGLPF